MRRDRFARHTTRAQGGKIENPFPSFSSIFFRFFFSFFTQHEIYHVPTELVPRDFEYPYKITYVGSDTHVPTKSLTKFRIVFRRFFFFTVMSDDPISVANWNDGSTLPLPVIIAGNHRPQSFRIPIPLNIIYICITYTHSCFDVSGYQNDTPLGWNGFLFYLF